ncbi:MAG: hypothetical protein RL141_500 [Candidatus Parcubacteria bacterium]|jgi:hypothetical protein
MTTREIDRAQQRHFGNFSLPLVETALTEEDQRYLNERGVRFLGEIFYIKFQMWGKFADRPQRIFAALAQHYGFVQGADPLKQGWEPPYWTDPEFLQALNVPVMEMLSKGIGRSESYRFCDAESYHEKGIHYTGGYLRQERRYLKTCTDLQRHEQVLRSNEAKIWAMALVPPTWRPPTEVPECWKGFSRKVRQAERRRKGADRGWLDEARQAQRDLARQDILRMVNPAQQPDGDLPPTLEVITDTSADERRFIREACMYLAGRRGR